METYICIGKCVPTPASLSRAPLLALPLPTGPLSLVVYPPLRPPLPRALHVPHQSFVPLVPTPDAHSRRSHDPAISLPTARIPARIVPLSPTACLRARCSRFFSPVYFLFFPQHAPEPSSDFYNLLLVAPHTTGRRRRCCRHRRVSGAAHPEKPENRGKQKRPARRAAHPAGWCAWTAVAGTATARGPGEGVAVESGPGERRCDGAGVADEKRKRHRGTPTQRIIHASACARLSDRKSVV